MRKKYLVGNWKMNNTSKDVEAFFEGFHPFYSNFNHDNIVVGIAPCYPYLGMFSNHKKIMLFSQNVHFKDSGAFTGEISVPMLKEFGVKGAIIGHSERRMYNNENSVDLALKVRHLLENDLVPLFCCGEDLATYQAGNSKKWIEKQVLDVFNEVKDLDLTKVIIAYEPIWSIGTGINASTEIAEDMCGFIRSLIKDNYGEDIAENIHILYGGSVKGENAHAYIHSPNIDGVLVGGASLTAAKFIDIVKESI